MENISIENLGYMENAEQMQKDEEPRLVENNVANEPADGMPALFSEDENLDTFKEENESLNQDFSDTLIDDDQNEEEDLEIPAFLRKQKN